MRRKTNSNTEQKGETDIMERYTVQATTGGDTSAPAARRVRVDSSGGVRFWATAVDKQPRPNAKGFVFKWQSAADVRVDRLQTNGVLLYGHDSGALPIGRIEKIDVNSRRVRMECYIPSYADNPAMQDWERVAAPVRQMIADGMLKAVSIGFIIEEAEETDTAIVVRKFEIVELSVVTIGAHDSALIEQTGDGTTVPAPAREAVPALVPAGSTWQTERQTAMTAVYRLALDTADPDADAEQEQEDAHDERDEQDPEPETDQEQEQAADAPDWRAIPWSRHGDVPLASESAKWDGPRFIGKATPDDLKIMSALEDKNALDTKRGYKLPHHKPDGTLVLRGAMAAMGVLLGARGGVKGVSDAEKRKAYAHLKKEYARFDRVPPEYRQDYDTEELKQLHADGVIEIPGQPPSVEFVLQVVDNTATAIRADVQAIRTADRNDTQQDAASTDNERDDDHVPQTGGDTAAPVESLRDMVRAMLAEDPELINQMQTQAASFVEMVAARNARNK